MKTGVIIGRFQVPILHLGHIYLISKALQNCDKVVILLGTNSGKDVDGRNPYTIEERWEAIKKVFPQVKMEVINDVNSDEEWSSNIDYWCDKHESPILYHSRDSFKSHYSGKYPTLELPELEGYSGTELRKIWKKEN